MMVTTWILRGVFICILFSVFLFIVGVVHYQVDRVWVNHVNNKRVKKYLERIEEYRREFE